MLRTCLTALMAASFLYSAPLTALADSKRDKAIEVDLRAIQLRCVEDDEDDDEVKELSVYLVNRYLDEVMYYVWFRDGVVVEAGLRLKTKNQEIPKWLYLAKRSALESLFDFSESDKKFIAGLLRDTEPHLKAGCRVPKPRRLEYVQQLKANLRITQGEAVPDPDIE
jgi:hypothetical protein